MTASDWVDRRAMDNHGDLIGVVVDVYDDPSSRRPAWLAISTGFFGTRVAVVPMRDASLSGDVVVVGHSRHAITSAPHVDVVVTIEPSQQQALVEHYASSEPPRRSTPFLNPESST